jgi:hypothetical protein
MNVTAINSVKSNSFLNADLIWNLQGAKDKQEVTRFLKRFETSLCVMAASTNQLYSNYTIEQSSHHDRLMVLPAPYAYHDTFQNITAEAMVSTNLFVVPGSVIAAGNSNLYLAWRKAGEERFCTMPLGQGLERLMHLGTADEPFLPVITTSDLRYLRQKTPIMHLNRLDINKLGHLSSFQISDIQTTIEAKVCCIQKAA